MIAVVGTHTAAELGHAHRVVGSLHEIADEAERVPGRASHTMAPEMPRDDV
ncbi:MAG: hypothetical protein HOQ03_11010 [Thermoleophilia bacterium]|nr:hypothetical protein [Thermoleophilia bacterium]